jgi:hypothetical protein
MRVYSMPTPSLGSHAITFLCLMVGCWLKRLEELHAMKVFFRPIEDYAMQGRNIFSAQYFGKHP